MIEWLTGMVVAVICGLFYEGAVQLAHWSVMAGSLLVVGLALGGTIALYIRLTLAHRSLVIETEQLRLKASGVEDDAKRANEQVAILRARLESARKSVPMPRHFTELIDEIGNDGRSHEYPYSYQLVQQEATIDRFGNYKGVYTHVAINDSPQPIRDYAFVLRTDTRAPFDVLKARAYVKIGNENPQEAQTSSTDPEASRYHYVRVVFPQAINFNVSFTVVLHFEWPKAILNGTDGDGLDLMRYKAVKAAALKLSFEQTVTSVTWWWKDPRNPAGTNAPLEPYPNQPDITDSKRQKFEIQLPHPSEQELIRTLYAFSCDLLILPDSLGSLTIGT